MMKVVLIPGMDGTGILFGPFIECVPDGVEVIWLPLIQRPDAGYVEQAQHIIKSIGNDPIVLVAESYSGMVAYNMLNIGCPNVRHIVFAASFITSPSWLIYLAKYLPIALLKSRFVPKSLMGWILFGRHSSSNLISAFYNSINSVDNAVLRTRLTQIAMLSKPSKSIEVPCTYIRPIGDRLVSKRSIVPFIELCKNLSIYEICGTHFVLQTNPQKCWQIILNATV